MFFNTLKSIQKSKPDFIQMEEKDAVAVKNAVLKISKDGQLSFDRQDYSKLKHWYNAIRYRGSGIMYGRGGQAATGVLSFGSMFIIGGIMQSAGIVELNGAYDVFLQGVGLVLLSSAGTTAGLYATMFAGMFNSKLFRKFKQNIDNQLYRELTRWMKLSYNIDVNSSSSRVKAREVIEAFLNENRLLYINGKSYCIKQNRLDDNTLLKHSITFELKESVYSQTYGQIERTVPQNDFRKALAKTSTPAVRELKPQFSRAAQKLIRQIEDTIAALEPVELDVQDRYAVNRAQKDLEDVIRMQTQASALAGLKDEPKTALRTLQNLYAELDTIKTAELEKLDQAFEIQDVYVNSRKD